MSNIITQYVAEQNAVRAIFNEKLLSSSTDLKNIRLLQERVYSDMSPEHLSCDGERHPAQMRSLALSLTRVQTELKKFYGPLHG